MEKNIELSKLNNKKTFEFASLLRHENKKVHLGFQRGFIWCFIKVSFEFSTEVRRMFHFHPNEPKRYKYLMHKARKWRKKIFQFSAVTKIWKVHFLFQRVCGCRFERIFNE
jgi:hypothetical protein